MYNRELGILLELQGKRGEGSRVSMPNFLPAGSKTQEEKIPGTSFGSGDEDQNRGLIFRR